MFGIKLPSRLSALDIGREAVRGADFAGLRGAEVLFLAEGVDRAEGFGLVLKDTVPPGPTLLVRFLPILVTLADVTFFAAVVGVFFVCWATFFLVVNCNFPFVLVTI